MRALTKRYHILFQNARSKSEVDQFRRLQKRPKINWLPQQRPLGYRETYVSFITPIHMCTNAERLVKFGLVLLRYLVRYADFCRLVPKVTETPVVISGVSGPIVIKLAKM